MIVMKFGGSSLESAEAITRVGSIVASQAPRDRLVVVSAIGKTTDKLVRLGAAARTGHFDEEGWSQLRASHVEIARELRLTEVSGIESLFAELNKTLRCLAAEEDASAAAWDQVASFGERLSSVIVGAALAGFGIAAVHLDARKVMVTDSHHTEAAPLVTETYAKVRRAVAQMGRGRVVVMGGFIASAEGTGEPTTLGRGGSDYSAALVGAALNAQEIQIWTDVDGMLSCDPRILPGGRCLGTISYEEAGEMARFGAKVLHPATVKPAMRQRVPVVIRNCRNPDAPGTRIVECTADESGAVKCIANLDGRVALVGHCILRDRQLGSRVVGALQERGIRISLGETSNTVFSFNVAQERVGEAVAALHREFFPDTPEASNASYTKRVAIST